MADNDIDRMVALTSPALPQFNTYHPPAIEEGGSMDSTTPTHMTAYFPAATGSEDITTLWGGHHRSTPINVTLHCHRSMEHSRVGHRSQSAQEYCTQQDLLRGRELLERLALEAKREKVARLTAKANLRNEIPESIRKDMERQITLHIRKYQTKIEEAIARLRFDIRKEA